MFLCLSSDLNVWLCCLQAWDDARGSPVCALLRDPKFFHLVRAEGDAVGRSVVTVVVNNSGPDIILAVAQQTRPKVPLQQISNFSQGYFFPFSLSASE